MAVSIKLFFVFLFLLLLGKGNCECSLSDISVSQTSTGSQMQGKTVWRATIRNRCICSQSSLKLDCAGFGSVTKVDPSILAISGSVCLVNGGSPIFEGRPISFTYAWDNPFPFKPSYSVIACS